MAEDEPETSGPPQFGYSGEASGPGYEFWREEICRRVMVVDIAPLAAGPVRCDSWGALLPQVKMAGAEGTPMAFRQSRGGNNGDVFAFVFSSETPMHIVQDDRSLDLAPMGIGLTDIVRQGGVSQVAEGRFQSLHINRKTLLDLCPNAEDLVARPLGASRGVKALLHQYYDLALHHAPGLDALAQNVVAQHLIDLVALALGAGRDETELAKGRGLAAARFEAIKADILARLGEGDLTLAGVAQRHRASPRYVQILFERDSTTFSQFVLEQRLIRAARLLRNPLHSARKISDIAHMSGFNDVSYFHRCFRRRFGATPADVRKS